jgi:hypothetical protein
MISENEQNVKLKIQNKWSNKETFGEQVTPKTKLHLHNITLKAVLRYGSEV